MRIFRSNHSDQWSTYQTSYENLSSQLIAFRPLTWAQPGDSWLDLMASGLLGGVER